MEIAFKDAKLRNCCQSSKLLTKQYGTDGAVEIKTFLSELRAAELFCDLHDYDYQLKSPQSIDLNVSETICITLDTNHINPPVGGNGNVSWDQVYRVKIMEIRQ